MSERKARIVVVEDHPMFRERLAQVIGNEQDLEIVGETDNAREALELVRTAAPDLALIDISLRGDSGLTLIKSLRAFGFTVPVLVLSMHEEALFLERVIRAGASGYITKLRASSEVLLAIRRVLAGGSYISSRAAAGPAKDPTELAEFTGLRALGRLTAREIEVFRLIGRGRTTREIAGELELGVASIDTYRARIKEKLRLRNASELQCCAIRWLVETDQGL